MLPCYLCNSLVARPELSFPHQRQRRTKVRVTGLVSVLLGLLVAVTLFFSEAAAEDLSKDGRQSAESILQTIASDIKKHYYDPKFHGLDWDAVVSDTKQKIDKSASADMALLHIAAAIDQLNDSHTFLLPPVTLLNVSQGYVTNWRSLMPLPNFRHNYGWEYEILGERSFVTHVRPGSDAEKKGLHVGDEILSINGYHPERATIERFEYVFNVLRPQRELKLEVVNPGGVKSAVTVAASFRQVGMVSQYEQSARAIRAYEDEQPLYKPRVVELGDELAIIKVPEFYLSVDAAQGLINGARKHKALILDLRENPGGSEDALKYLLGGLFDHDVTIGDKAARVDRKPLIAKPLHNTFQGKVAVLIDSRSASAAEIFSRVVQIEKRGVVIGDRTSGEVMSAKHYHYRVFETATWYGVSITEADLIMTDGRSLEHVGVTPDEVIVPSATDLVKERDPALARAAETLGVALTPEAAGKLFPYQWPPK
jgi:carboxyl-terminal processing protease